MANINWASQIFDQSGPLLFNHPIKLLVQAIFNQLPSTSVGAT